MSVTFTVIIPTHDRRDTVVLAVRSALAQTRPPDEVIVIADGCSDGTEKAVGAIAHPAVELLSLPKAPGYGYGYRTTAMRRARGTVVAWLCDDDLWLPDHLERLGELFDAGAADIVQATPAIVRPDGSLDGAGGDWSVAHFRARLLAERDPGWPGWTPSSCVSHVRALALDAGGWNPDLPRAGDRDLWQRMLRAGARPALVAAPTVLSFQATGRRQPWAERVTQNAALLQRLGDPAQLAALRRDMARAVHTRIANVEDQDHHRGLRIAELEREVAGLRAQLEDATARAAPPAGGARGRLRRARTRARQLVAAAARRSRHAPAPRASSDDRP
ncbi:MAG: glycosyltransferase family 2 protein [Thermoleophilia bacterium]